MTPFKRVAILWAIVLAVFAAFAAAWFPVHQHQELHDPANFVSLAESMMDTDPEVAFETLRTGIQRFRPPVARPYARFAEKEGRSPKMNRLAEFYTALATPLTERTAAVAAAGRAAFQVADIHAPGEDAAGYIDICIGSLGLDLDLGHVVNSFTFRQKAGLLWLAGGGALGGPEIGTTGVRSPVDILLYSAGGPSESRGAHLLLRGRDYADRGRGIYAAIIDRESGQVAQLGRFDLWDDAEEAERMLEFLDSAPEGCIAAFTVADDASLNITPELETALVGFGLERQAWIGRVPRLYGLRYSFAAIGVKGAAKGTALQAWSPDTFELDGQRYPGHPVVVGILGAEGGES